MASDTTKPAPREHPLRQAAEALDFLATEVFADKVVPWLILPLVLVPYAVLEWLRFGLGTDSFPKTATVLAIAGVAAAAVMIRRRLVETAAQAGRAGGRVEDALAALAERGYHVFHEVPCGDFEIGHVVVGRSGIYTIETQALEKPAGKRARIVVDRSGLAAPGRLPRQDLLARASAQASSLGELLKEATSRSLRVRPVLLFPGWSIEQKCPRMSSDPWVLDTRSFVRMIERAQPVLDDEQVMLASYQIWRACEGGS